MLSQAKRRFLESRRVTYLATADAGGHTLWLADMCVHECGLARLHCQVSKRVNNAQNEGAERIGLITPLNLVFCLFDQLVQSLGRLFCGLMLLKIVVQLAGEFIDDGTGVEVLNF